MSYVIAAYGLTFGALLAYGVHLARERQAVERDAREARAARK